MGSSLEPAVVGMMQVHSGGAAPARTVAGGHGGRGSGRFKRILWDEGIEDQWFAYRDEALKTLAVEFLETEGIPFESSPDQ